MHRANPFDDDLALANSRYLAYRDGQLVDALTSASPPEPARIAHDHLRAMVLDPAYPCVGARSLVSSGGYRLGWYGRMATPEATAGLCRDLCSFVQEQPAASTKFTSFFAMFQGPNPANEEEFERLLWGQLQAVHDLDSCYHGWDPAVSDDPADSRFAFSVVGRGFFIVGLHAGSSPDRRFAHPTLIFNPESVFDRLWKDKKYEPMKRVVRARTEKLGLRVNPNLATFGESLAARQYSGRRVEPDWTCPLVVHRRGEFGPEDVRISVGPAQDS